MLEWWKSVTDNMGARVSFSKNDRANKVLNYTDMR